MKVMQYKKYLAFFFAVASILYIIDISFWSDWHQKMELPWFIGTVIVKLFFLVGSVLFLFNYKISRHLILSSLVLDLLLSFTVYPLQSNSYSYFLLAWVIILYFLYFRETQEHESNA